MGLNIPVRRVEWLPCWRIIPSRFPPIDLFERIADPADLQAVFELESLTNDRMREEVGDLSLVPEEDRVSGPGASIVMAAFTHVSPAGSRFTDGSFGVFYAGLNLTTAVDETRYHRERFMTATNEPRMELDMRVYNVDLAGDLHDVSGMHDALPEIYHESNYSASQQLGRLLRGEGSWGIVYDSVRSPGGSCAGVFRPPVLSNCRQERHLCYVWDGARIADIYEKSAFTPPEQG